MSEQGHADFLSKASLLAVHLPAQIQHLPPKNDTPGGGCVLFKRKRCILYITKQVGRWSARLKEMILLLHMRKTGQKCWHQRNCCP